MTHLKSHLVEIKLRTLYLFFSLICTFFVSYTHSVEMVYVLGKPFMKFEQTFIFLELTEAFYTFLRISAISTFLLMIPFFFYHVWVFFLPSFYQAERVSIILIYFFMISLFVSELFFIYFILLPKICNFLMSFEISAENYQSEISLGPLISVEFSARIESYVKLIIKILTVILLVLQIPLCVCFFYSKRILHVSNFYSNRKFLILFSLLTAAFLVPPDVLSQLLFTFLLFLVFELLIFLGLFFE